MLEPLAYSQPFLGRQLANLFASGFNDESSVRHRLGPAVCLIGLYDFLLHAIQSEHVM